MNYNEFIKEPMKLYKATISKNINIIIADDHKLFSNGLELLLKQNSIDFQIIKIFFNGKEVIEWINHNPIAADILLIDINMPEINGIEVLRYIKKNKIPIKILVISMYNDPAFIRQVIAEGAHGYLLKNTDDKELINAIQCILENNFYLNEIIQKQIEDLGKEKMILSNREVEVLKLLAKGFSTKSISQQLYISNNTVESHRKNLLKKLNVKNTAELINIALKMQIMF